MAARLRIALFAGQDAPAGALWALRQAGHRVEEHDSLQSLLSGARPDVLLNLGNAVALPTEVLSRPTWGAVNVHPAPLPQYRGPQAFRWGIVHDVSSWEVTSHLMTPAEGEGDVLHRQPVAIGRDDNAWQRWQACGEAMVESAVEVMEQIATDRLNPIPQKADQAKFYGELPYDGCIDWNQPAARVAAFIRAMDFGHFDDCMRYQRADRPAQAVLDGQSIGIWRGKAGGVMSAYPPGTITRCDAQVWVQTRQGHFAIEKMCTWGLAGVEEDHDAGAFFERHGYVVGMRFDLSQTWPTETQLTLSRAA